MASSSKPVSSDDADDLGRSEKAGTSDDLGIEKYLPEFKGIKLMWQTAGKAATNGTKHLLCNMSGLPGDFLAESLLKRLRKGVGKDPDEVEEKEKGNAEAGFFSRRNRSLAESVRGLAEGGLATEPGTEFHYCTMGFNVAARVAEVAANQPFEELIRTELLDPVGMNETRYTPFGLQALGPNPRLPGGESRFIMAGGGMTSTLDDFAAFYQMHLNGGTYNNRRILSDQSTATMHTRQAKLELLAATVRGMAIMITGSLFSWTSSMRKVTPVSSLIQGCSEPPPGSMKTANLSACFSCSPISCGSSPWFATFRPTYDRCYRHRNSCDRRRLLATPTS